MSGETMSARRPTVVVRGVDVTLPTIDADPLSRAARRGFSTLRRRYPRLFTRPQTRALTDASLEVAEGELLAVIGPNGAGKSTLLNLLAGHIRPDGAAKDAVEILGVAPWRGRQRRHWREKVAMLPQAAEIEPWATVDELLRRSGRLYAASRDLPVHDVLEMVGLEDQRHQRVRALSGGQRRKLDLGLILIGRPQVLLLDEPFNDLDRETAEVVWRLLRDAATAGSTVVLTTHQLVDVALADRVLLLSEGRTENLDPRSAWATVRWTAHDVPSPHEIRGLRAIDHDRDRWTILSDNPEETLADLLAWTEATGTRLAALTVQPAARLFTTTDPVSS